MFVDRAEKMGLNVVGEGDRRVCVHDGQLAKIAYVPLKTIENDLGLNNTPGHIGLYVETGDEENKTWQFNSILSDGYEFTSFESLIESARSCIVRNESVIYDEKTILTIPPVSMKYQIAINNPTEVKADDGIYIYPLIIVESAYNGTKANHMNFGIMIEERKDGKQTTKNLPIKSFGKIKSIHTSSGSVDFNAPIGEITNQMTGISDVVKNMFEMKMDDDTLGAFMITIDGIGKRHMQKMSNEISLMTGEAKTYWDVFRVILAYTENVSTINVREKIEDAIEKFFNFPAAVSKIIEENNNKGE